MGYVFPFLLSASEGLVSIRPQNGRNVPLNWGIKLHWLRPRSASRSSSSSASDARIQNVSSRMFPGMKFCWNIRLDEQKTKRLCFGLGGGEASAVTLTVPSFPAGTLCYVFRKARAQFQSGHFLLRDISTCLSALLARVAACTLPCALATALLN